MRTTIKKINAYLKAQFPGVDIEFVKGYGYFYVSGAGVSHWPEQGFYGTDKLGGQSAQEWVDEIAARMVENEKWKGE